MLLTCMLRCRSGALSNASCHFVDLASHVQCKLVCCILTAGFSIHPHHIFGTAWPYKRTPRWHACKFHLTSDMHDSDVSLTDHRVSCDVHTSNEDNRQTQHLTAHATLQARAHTETNASVGTPPENFLSHFVPTCFAADTSSDKQCTAIILEP